MKPYLMFYSLWRLASLTTIIMLLTITGWANGFQPSMTPFDFEQVKTYKENNGVRYIVKDIANDTDFAFKSMNEAQAFASAIQSMKTKAFANIYGNTYHGPLGEHTYAVPVSTNGVPVAVNPDSFPSPYPSSYKKFNPATLTITWSDTDNDYHLIDSAGVEIGSSYAKVQLEQLKELINFYEVDVIRYICGFNECYTESPWGYSFHGIKLFLTTKPYREAATLKAKEEEAKKAQRGREEEAKKAAQLRKWQDSLNSAQNAGSAARGESASKNSRAGNETTFTRDISLSTNWKAGNETAFMMALLNERLTKEFLAKPPFPIDPLDPVARRIKEGGERFLLALTKFEDQTRTAPDRTRAAQDSEISKARKEYELAFNGYLKAPDANSLRLNLQRMAAAVKLIGQNIATRPSR
jgi:hypothetical protein